MKHRYISLLAVPLLFCSARMRAPSTVEIIYPAPRCKVIETEERDSAVNIPEIKAIEPVVSGEAPEQVERYPGVNLNALDNDNAREVCIRLLNAGLPYPAIAGILANIERESNYNPSTINSIGAVGLCQWLGARAAALYQRDNCYSVKTQVEFLLDELELTDNACDLSGNAYDCGYIFARDFERTCIASTYRDRGALAEEIYEEVFQ